MATTNADNSGSTGGEGSYANEPSTALAANATASTVLKRKFTDPDLELITIDQHYDLTLVVGSPDHVNGQKAFRINRGSMRRVSDVWSNMLEGDWAERKKSEIGLPDDSCRAVELILRIAHWQFEMLPLSLTVQELVELAVLTDKYNLKTVVGLALRLTSWLSLHRLNWTVWTPTVELQDFALISSLLAVEVDYEFVVSRLAVEVEVDKENFYYYYAGPDTSRVKLRSGLPDSILNRISKTRNMILSSFAECCQKAIDECLDETDKTKAPCSKDLCSASRLGIMIKELHKINLYPVPAGSDVMLGSVLDYWKGIKNLGSTYKPYHPCDRLQNGRKEHWSTCTFNKCLAGFGMKDIAEELLKQILHKDVVRHMQSLI